MKGVFVKTTLAASVTNTLFELYSDVIKGWQNLLQGVHAVDGPPYNTLAKVIQWHFRRRWRWLLWLLLLVLCLLLLFHNFLSGWSANASEYCCPVPYTIQWQFHSRPFLLLAELVHVFNSSSCIVAVSPYKLRHFAEWSHFTCALYIKTCFFCKHVNHKTKLATLRKQKKKKKIYWGSNPQPCYQILWVKPFFLLRHRIACKVIL